jgi:hypothetical protein
VWASRTRRIHSGEWTEEPGAVFSTRVFDAPRRDALCSDIRGPAIHGIIAILGPSVAIAADLRRPFMFTQCGAAELS